jgi:hypothetical protein
MHSAFNWDWLLLIAGAGVGLIVLGILFGVIWWLLGLGKKDE